MRLSATYYADLLGAPFVWKGRGPSSFDCWGLVLEVMRRTGVDVPDWPSDSDGSVNHATVLHAIASGWERLEAPTAGCAVLFRLPHGPHIGVMVDDNKFLHVTKSTLACVERLSDALWRDRIVGFYRWTGQTAA